MSKRTKHNSFLKCFLIFIIIISLLLTSAVVIISNTSLKEKILEKFKISETLLTNEPKSNLKTSLYTQNENQTLLEETNKADNNYFNDILFVGDSRTVGLVDMGFIDSSNVLAEIGLCHKDALDTSFEQDYNSYTIKEYLYDNSPRVIMIGFGINGISYMNQDDFMNDYSNLIDTIMEYSPNSKIVIESILPVGETMEYQDDRYNNETVKEYNQLLYDMCVQKNIYYMDLYNCLIDENTGYLNEEYDSGDGLHFNKYAYEQIIDYMLTHTI